VDVPLLLNPQYMLRSRLGCSNTEINDIGNLRFFGATDNVHKRAELPASYFSRLKALDTVVSPSPS
jgi:hypothetical protein